MDKLFLKKLWQAVQVPIAVYRGEALVFLAPEDYQPVFLREPHLLRRISRAMAPLDQPALFLESEQILYGAMKDGDELIILGPASRAPVDEDLKLRYRHVHGLTRDTVICRMELREMREVLALLLYEADGRDIRGESIRISTINEAVQGWDLDMAEEEYRLETSETEMDHNSAAFERRLLEIVRTGDMEVIDRIIHGSDTLETEHIGNVATQADKKAEYLAVALITLLSRAAVDGGMDQEEAYGKADVYLQRLEQCKSAAEMYALASRAEYDFTLSVHTVRERASRISYVEQCKSYIEKNLRRPFSVEDIAQALGMNRTYLARRFTEAEGISIRKYIMRERCAHAANMLRYSDYPIALIAEYFCFSSQSHFGKTFREFYGMTPKEYRMQHQK